MIRTHYDVLGVSQSATTADIRAAYKQLVLVLHPDRIASAAMHRGGASSPITLQISGTGTQKLSNFQAVQDAYAVLSNDIQRTMYDAELDCQRPTTAPDLSPDGRAMSPTTRWAGANSSPPHPRFQPAKKAAALVPDVELRRMAEHDQIVAEANAEWDRRFVLTRQGILSRRPSSQQQRRTSGTASRFPSAGMNLGYQLNPDNGRTAYPPMPQEEDVVLHSSPPLPFASSACTTMRPPTSGGGSSCPLPIPSFTPKSLPSASSHPVSSNDRASVPLTLGGRQLSASSSSAGRSHHPPLRGRLGSASLLPNNANHPPLPSCGPVSGIGAPSFTPILSSSAAPAAVPAVGAPRDEEEEGKDTVLPYAPRLRRHGSGAPMAPVRKEAFVGKAMFGVSRRSLSMGALKNSGCNKNVGDAAPHGPSQQQLASERTLRIFFS